MFTGIVTAIGRITAIKRNANGMRLAISPDSGHIALDSCRPGDSVSVAGVCLTMLEPNAEGFDADVSAETLGLTTLGHRKEGDLVNLELAMKTGDRLGGHLVSGHVDAAVGLLASSPDGESLRLDFELPSALAKYVVRKGSACLDGVSLTVNAVSAERLSVCIIPHTLSASTLGSLRAGDRVNLEVDMVARYLERLIEERSR